MRFANYDFYGPEEDVLGHYIIFYGRVYIVTRGVIIQNATEIGQKDVISLLNMIPPSITPQM